MSDGNTLRSDLVFFYIMDLCTSERAKFGAEDTHDSYVGMIRK